MVLVVARVDSLLVFWCYIALCSASSWFDTNHVAVNVTVKVVIQKEIASKLTCTYEHIALRLTLYNVLFHSSTVSSYHELSFVGEQYIRYTYFMLSL